MDRFWTPWRGEYIEKSITETNDGCVLCDLVDVEPSKSNLVVYSNKVSYVVMNKYPYNNGHVMIVPNKHVDSFEQLSDEEYQNLAMLLKKTIKVIQNVYSPQGCNVGLNLGRAAGAGLHEHIHYHVVPRWNGDTNFMPVFSEVKVISEHIHSTYDKLYKEFKEV